MQVVRWLRLGAASAGIGVVIVAALQGSPPADTGPPRIPGRSPDHCVVANGWYSNVTYRA